eukprot:SAG31_NODE_4587_length_3110_cov_3.378944_4_plen_101_part_00
MSAAEYLGDARKAQHDAFAHVGAEKAAPISHLRDAADNYRKAVAMLTVTDGPSQPFAVGHLIPFTLQVIVSSVNTFYGLRRFAQLLNLHQRVESCQSKKP